MVSDPDGSEWFAATVFDRFDFVKSRCMYFTPVAFADRVDSCECFAATVFGPGCSVAGRLPLWTVDVFHGGFC